jgi:hypothetical protein
VATAVALKRGLVAVVAEVDLVERTVLEGHHAMVTTIRHRLLAVLVLEKGKVYGVYTFSARTNDLGLCVTKTIAFSMGCKS